MDSERHLAAILSADVVGYSSLMAEDEAATVRTVTAYREEVELHVRQKDWHSHGHSQDPNYNGVVLHAALAGCGKRGSL